MLPQGDCVKSHPVRHVTGYRFCCVKDRLWKSARLLSPLKTLQQKHFQSKPKQILLTRVLKCCETSEENVYVESLVCITGFHAVDLDSASVNDLFIPSQVSFMIGFYSCWSGLPLWFRCYASPKLVNDLCWVAKRTLEFTQVHASRRRTHFKTTGLVFHWLIGCYKNEWTSLILRWLRLVNQSQTVKNV